MKWPKILAILFLSALLGLMLYGTARAQDDDALPTAVPPTVEVKGDDYVVVDKEVYRWLVTINENQQIINGKIDWIMAQLDGPAEVAPPSVPAINVNTASYDGLLQVPGIGPVKAGAIIAERGQNGEFADWQDLQRRVSGVGPSTIADMQAGGAVLE